MIKDVKIHINNNFSFLNESKLLLAISGGLDSVVLAYICKTLQLDFSLAHCNFSLRAEESNADEFFVKQLAKQLKVNCYTKTFNTEIVAKEEKLSIQLAARKLRYTWFKEISQEKNLDYILTAHHADDNLETILINLSRGTGIEGLTGIPPINNTIVRPLLPFPRETIKLYAQRHAIKWREDSSNTSKKYLRNKLRHDVIPVLKSINPNLLANINTTVLHLNETKTIVAEGLKTVLKRTVKLKTEDEIVYHISEFKKLKPLKPYIHQIFKHFNFTAFNDIVDLLDAQSGKMVKSKTHQLLKDRETLILTKINIDYRFFKVINTFKTIETPLGILTFEKVLDVDKNEKYSIFVDQDLLKFPLTVSSKQLGDYFYPLGMQGKKKLSKFLKDEKLSLIAKEKVLILRTLDAVVWVINHRLDNRFKVTKSTKSIIKISLK